MEGDWLHATLNIDKDVIRTWDWVDYWTNQEECDIIEESE